MESQGEKEELIHIHHGLGRVEMAAFASIESSELKKLDNTCVNVSFPLVIIAFFFPFSFSFFFFFSLSAAKWKHKHKHKHTHPAALDGNVTQKAFKKDYGTANK